MYGLPDETLERIKGVVAKFPEVESVIIYGSRAMGKERAGSDIDLAFVGDALTLTRLNEIHSALDELDLPYTFDTALYSEIENEALQDHIRRVGKTIFELSSKVN